MCWVVFKILKTTLITPFALSLTHDSRYIINEHWFRLKRYSENKDEDAYGVGAASFRCMGKKRWNPFSPMARTRVERAVPPCQFEQRVLTVGRCGPSTTKADIPVVNFLNLCANRSFDFGLWNELLMLCLCCVLSLLLDSTWAGKRTPKKRYSARPMARARVERAVPL
jgi:hypothetical protein